MPLITGMNFQFSGSLRHQHFTSRPTAVSPLNLVPANMMLRPATESDTNSSLPVQATQLS